MGQNMSTAVMQRRHEARDSLDSFDTPPWATRALLERLSGPVSSRSMTAREPAAGRGFMAAALAETFGRVEASDVNDYGVGFAVADYLFGDHTPVDWTITNPPFRLAMPFIETALATSRRGVAMFLRTSFVEGQGRYFGLFEKTPPSLILHFAERVVLHKGPPPDPDQPGPDGRKPTTATSYSWFVWTPGSTGAATAWIGPCRKRLTRPGDYAPRGGGNPPEETSVSIPEKQKKHGGAR